MNKQTLSHEEIASLETALLEEATGGFKLVPGTLVHGIPAPGTLGGPGGLGDVVDTGGFPFGIIRSPFDPSL
jgi:hypothetical protein